MYAQTSIAVSGLLAGWMLGLTGHAFYYTQWRDRAARAAWLTVTDSSCSAACWSPSC
jgi:hypothetical protein